MILLISFLIVLAMLSTKLSTKIGLPLLIGFILIGVAVGSDGLGWFDFPEASKVKDIADFLLILIIFEGGFCVTRESFKSVAGTSLTLATLGVVLTAAILGLFIHFVFKFDLIYSFVISSIISSTDAAAVFMITKANPIKNKLATTLNVESAANDPMAIILTITFIQIAMKDFSSPGTAILLLIWQFTGGILIGYVGCKITVFLFNQLKSDSRGNYSVLIIGCILFAYGASEYLKANGIIAVFFMGYWLGNCNFPAKRSVSSFLDSVSAIFNIGLFIMLGLLSEPSKFGGIWKESLIIVAIMMFVARPLAVMLSTMASKYSLKEKFFLSWGGVKGAVPIVLATYPAAYKMEGYEPIFNIIFFAVFISCIVQGTTLGPLSKLLKFTEPKKPESPHSVELHSMQASELDMFELLVKAKAPCINHTLSEINFGKEVLISAIIRRGKLLMPKGNTKIKANDILFVLAKSSSIEAVNEKLNKNT